jgi:hypothetical protein
MTLNKYSALFCTALLAASSTVGAVGIEKGDKTMSIFGSLTFADDSDTLLLSGAFGQFMTDVLELQGQVMMISSDSDTYDYSMTGLGVNANYYLPGNNPNLVPYFGGGAQLIFSDSGGRSDTDLGLNVQAGIKQFLNESTTINYQGMFVTSDNYDATILSVGLTIFLE